MDSLLSILKFALLALLYLFFARVLWAVWSEVRGPRKGVIAAPGNARAAAPTGPPAVQPSAQPGMAPPVAGKPRRADKAAKVAAGKGGAVARLIVLEPKASKGTALGLANEITFGRAPGCTVSVPDDSFVSQVHARVFNDQGTIIVEDLGSTNGTYVNGTRLTSPRPLQRGDRLQIGSTVLEAN